MRAGADAAAARVRRWALMLVGAAALVAFAYGAGTAAPKAVADFLSRPGQGGGGGAALGSDGNAVEARAEKFKNN